MAILLPILQLLALVLAYRLGRSRPAWAMAHATRTHPEGSVDPSTRGQILITSARDVGHTTS